jgi:hypothetical protein
MTITNLWQFAWQHDTFRATLAIWLSTLPSEGWVGTIFELEIALNNAARRRRCTRYGRRPTANALGVRMRAERAFLMSHGFELTSLRSSKQRGIRISAAAQKVCQLDDYSI